MPPLFDICAFIESAMRTRYAGEFKIAAAMIRARVTLMRRVDDTAARR